MAGMRRRFADRNEGIMNPRLRESNYTAGRETWRPGFEQTGEGAMRMNIPKNRQENIPYSAGRSTWGGPQDIHRYKTGHLPGWGPTADAGSGKNWLSKIGATAGELFGGRSAMADEDEEMRLLRSGLDANTGYGSGVGSSLELMDADSQSELLNTLGLTADAVGVPTGGGGVNLDTLGTALPGEEQGSRTMKEDVYEQVVGPRNFVDPERSSLLGKDVMVNYPGQYRITPGVMKSLGSDMFGAEQTRGPVGQGFYPPNTNRNWRNLWGLFNRGGIASLRRYR